MARKLLGFLIALVLILIATSPCAAEDIRAELGDEPLAASSFSAIRALY